MEQQSGNLSYVIKSARKMLGLSTAQLANAAGMRRDSIDAIERGRGVTLEERQMLAATFTYLAAKPIQDKP